MSRPAPCLCIFFRAPEPGQVKTRLVRDLGADTALLAYERLLAHTLEALSGIELPVQFWVTGDPSHPQIGSWRRRLNASLHTQPTGDLGERMLAALAAQTQTGRAGILVGVDLPCLDAAYVRKAAAALTRNDLVLGPTEDGGYGLIALREAQPALFHDMPWGGSTVLAETRQRAMALGLRTHELSCLWDVDTASDWARFLAWRSRQGAACWPRDDA